MNTVTDLYKKLETALLVYDRRQMNRHWNPNALRLYLERVKDICEDVRKGADPRAAICAGFTGGPLRAALRAIGEKPTNDELIGAGKYTYQRVSESK